MEFCLSTDFWKPNNRFIKLTARNGRRYNSLNMKIVFFGTPEYVVPILDRLHKEYVTGPGKSPIVAVVTQPPKPVGREQIKTYSAVDKWAHARQIPTYYSTEELIEDGFEAEFGVCAAYGEIMPKEIFGYFKLGILNIHPSLLPKYRGASPIQNAIANGDETTGVSIMKMDEKMDHGPIITQFKEDILPTDTMETLRDRLFARSAEVLIEMIEPYMKNKIKVKPQEDENATFTKMITKEDGLVNLKTDDPKVIDQKLRAYKPWPGIWSVVTIKEESKRLKILSGHLEDNKFIPEEVQLEGKKPVSWKQFEEAYKIEE